MKDPDAENDQRTHKKQQATFEVAHFSCPCLEKLIGSSQNDIALMLP
jgi:hypothetical protein